MTLADEVLQRTIRPDVIDMHAYAVQPSDGLVKLDVMENPHRLPEALRRALGERLAQVAINRYPGERLDELKAALAAHSKVPDGCAVTLGNGSDELIAMLGLAVSRPGAVVMSPLPSFVYYALTARLQGLRFVGVPLTADFELDEAAMLAAIDAHRPAVLYLAQPNNPTANLWDDAAIDRIVDAMAAARGLVVIDEAYGPFSPRDAMARVRAGGHVLSMRTLSKFGLAGVRIGWLAGDARLVAQIDKVRPPYNVGVLNAEAALFALEHVDEYAAQAAAIRGERDRLAAALAAIPGVRAFPSDANMILARVADPARVFAAMKSRGVLVKDVSAMHPGLAGCLRLTVGSAEENRRMLDALRASV